ncbi:pentapeptide repeat-containing protein [Leptodesmis sp.]|uniref:pentapeptide repeat-containing protein n=1 Tax=Leptodesmis sp. TaxID=3100501 RepID=UPI00405355E1
MTEAKLSGANLTEANLTGAILHATNLQSAHLTKSILTGVQLEYCLMNDETDLTDCLCDYICIGQEKIDILKKEDLELLKGDLEGLRTMSKN